MPTSEQRPDGTLVVEAGTAAEALAEVGAVLGDDAEIITAEKVHRGGWNGFFAHELVQLIARPRQDASSPATSPATSAAAPPPPPPAPADAPTGRSDAPPPEAATGPDAPPADELTADGLAAALARMTRAAEHEETAFRDVLVRELAAPTRSPAGEPADVPPAPAVPDVAAAPAADVAAPAAADVTAPAAADVPPPAAPAPWAPEEARTATGVAWDLERLRALRLPAAVLDACRGLAPGDDHAWMEAVAAAVASWCRPLPARDAALVGPRAHRLGGGLGVPARRPGEPVPATGPVALRIADSAVDRSWADEVVGERWRHLVVGGRGWQGLLLDDVTAVSWVGVDAVPAALGAAARLGLVLGYGLSPVTGPDPVRVTPIDVALSVRALLPRH